jgi:hypothetical protein
MIYTLSLRRMSESIGISIWGTRMNTDCQDIKSYKKPNICGNLCPNLIGEIAQEKLPN